MSLVEPEPIRGPPPINTLLFGAFLILHQQSAA